MDDNAFEILDFAILFYIQYKSRTAGAMHTDLKKFYLSLKDNDGEDSFLTRLEHIINENWLTMVSSQNKEKQTVDNRLYFISKDGLKQYERFIEFLPVLNQLMV